ALNGIISHTGITTIANEAMRISKPISTRLTRLPRRVRRVSPTTTDSLISLVLSAFFGIVLRDTKLYPKRPKTASTARDPDARLERNQRLKPPDFTQS